MDGDSLLLDSSQPGGSGEIAGQTKFRWGGPPFQVRPWPPFGAFGAGVGSDTLIAQAIVLDHAATLTQLEVWLISANGGDFQFALYDDTGTDRRPGALLADTGVVPGVDDRMVVDVLVPVVLAPGVYWIAFNNSNGCNFKASSSDTGWKVFINATTFGTMPNPFGAVDGDQGEAITMAAHFNTP